MLMKVVDRGGEIPNLAFKTFCIPGVFHDKSWLYAQDCGFHVTIALAGGTLLHFWSPRHFADKDTNARRARLNYRWRFWPGKHTII